MSEAAWKNLRRSIVPVTVLVTALVTAATFRPELVAWFGGDAITTDDPAGTTVELEDSLLTDEDSDSGSGDDEIAYYTCSMHPSVRSDEPGQCPICSMDLTPVTKAEQESGVLRIDGRRAQQLGVRYAAVELETLSREVVAVGEVKANENRLTDVTLRTAGWIDRLYVEETGEYVGRGQPLFEVYSPDVLTASEEALAARRVTGPARDRLVAAADRKLLLLGVTKRQLARLVARGKARDRISVASTTAGYVVEKHLVEGDHVEQGKRLLRIADLSEVWVNVQVYEADLSLVKLGQPVTVTLPFVPGQRFEGEIGYIHPRLDHETRTVPARVVLDNPDLVLRPGMYAEARIEVDLGERLVVPEESVIYSGPRRLVFVDLGEGRLQPKVVEVGLRASGLVEVLDGVEAGERVVSSGNFLIAAESRIRSAMTIWATDPDSTVDPAKEDETPAFDHEHEGPYYTCGMHPEVHEHEPGRCPVCHMDLEPRGGPDTEAATDMPRDDEPKPKRRQRKKPKQRMERVEDGADSPAEPTPSESETRNAEPTTTQYNCPMHPQVVQEGPGQCPICHMNLVPRKEGAKP